MDCDWREIGQGQSPYVRKSPFLWCDRSPVVFEIGGFIL